MIFTIDPKQKYTITLIGAGGTGGYLIQILSRIAYESDKSIEIFLVDGDKVEKKNVGRQNFYNFEIGEYKAQVLAERYSLALGVKIIPVNFYLQENISQHMSLLYKSDFIISCVDSAKARNTIHKILLKIKESMKNSNNFTTPGMQIWIDTGNSKNSGQILIGNSFDIDIIKKQKGKNIYLLPYPSIIEPDIINSKKEKKKEENSLSCAERISLNQQSTTINQLMASTTGSILNNLIEKGKISNNKIIINEDFPMTVSQLTM